jgi:8-oxo-dGTP pyrophosphatase MutT (NUDIX family)
MTNYMAELRSKMGHRPLIMVGATLLPLTKTGQLLMLKRNDNGFWGVPGGAMELNESLEDTARREAKEEAGIDVKEMDFFKVYSGPDFNYTYPNGDQVCIVTAVFITNISNQTISVGKEEHCAFGFFDLEHLPADTSPIILPILRDLTEFLSKKNLRYS